MEKHKSKALDNDCLCSKCVFRFQCFTQERVFSDPIFQGLFEALMAQGKSREEALDEVAREIKFRINTPITLSDPPQITIPYPNSAPDAQPYQPYSPWTVISYEHDNVTFQSTEDGTLQVSYTMHNGKEVNWNADSEDLFRKLRIYREGSGNSSNHIGD